MQTIESIRRTNELSKVLSKHGFASDTFDAMSQAKDIVEEPSTVLEADHGAPAAQPEEKQGTQERIKEPANFDNKIANLERSKHMLAARVDSLQKELEKTQEHLKQVLHRVDSAEARLRSQQAQPAPQQSAPQASQAQEQQAQPAQSQQPAQPQQVEQPMSDTKRQQLDSSLSVENVFYSGVR